MGDAFLQRIASVEGRVRDIGRKVSDVSLTGYDDRSKMEINTRFKDE